MDITIIIPVYNRKGLVQKTLDSIPDTFNIIIVDNGSTDGSYEFCRQWMLNSRRKNVVVDREFNLGASNARNKGLSLCKTKWVYFFDSDDVFTGLPSAWNENMDLVCFPVNMLVNGKNKIRDYKPVADAYVHILNSMLDTQSMLFRTEWLKEIGGWNADCKVWNDWELGLRALINKPRLQWITDKSYQQIIVHGDSLTGNKLSDNYKDRLNTLSVAFDEIYDMKSGQEKQKALFALFLRSYIFSGQLLKERDAKASEEIENFIYDKFSVNKQSHQMGRIFRWYTSKGGRGSWKIALKLVEISS